MNLKERIRSRVITLNNKKKEIQFKGEYPPIPYDKLSPMDWGFIYEKYVGQTLEKEGYSVKYQGLNLGILDRGIDLIAENQDCINFIQCKFIKSTIGKKKIDWILYKASSMLYESFKTSGKELKFTLVVKDIDQNFSKKIPKKFKLNFTDRSKIKYPWLQYFLDHNYVQQKIKLEYREIPLNTTN